ncbi:MAG: alanine racemase [Firmicutes bacterium]|nr:alanine racemase [Bacillota bacterium]
MKYPILNVDLDAIRENAAVMCRFCGSRGIDVAGVIKFSDGDTDIAKAYLDGGCSQIASSRIVHLQKIKEEIPGAETMLIRIPMISEAEEVVKWADMSLNSEEAVLRELDAAAGRLGRTHRVILMQDVGDRREGVIGSDALTALALLVENELDNLYLAGIGASFACISGVLPDKDNLGLLAESARQIETAIGRKLDIVSGGSSITLTLLANGKPLPSEINHLRIGGAIANPIGIRLNRGVVIEGMNEDTFTLTAEIIETGDKPSVSQRGGKNWAGKEVSFEDTGIRTRVIVALGSQDIGDASQLIPKDPGIKITGCSSDHTVLDITDAGKKTNVGDTVSFRLFYMPLLYCFATRHVRIEK